MRGSIASLAQQDYGQQSRNGINPRSYANAPPNYPWNGVCRGKPIPNRVAHAEIAARTEAEQVAQAEGLSGQLRKPRCHVAGPRAVVTAAASSATAADWGCAATTTTAAASTWADRQIHGEGATVLARVSCAISKPHATATTAYTAAVKAPSRTVTESYRAAPFQGWSLTLPPDAEGGAKTLTLETNLRDHLPVYSAVASRPDTRFPHKQDQRSRSMRIQPALGHLPQLVFGNLEAVAV